MTLLNANTPSQSGPGSDGSEGVLRIPQSSSITGVSLSDCLVSYPGHWLGEYYPSAEMQLAYSAASADWANMVSRNYFDLIIIIIIIIIICNYIKENL